MPGGNPSTPSATLSKALSNALSNTLSATSSFSLVFYFTHKIFTYTLQGVDAEIQNTQETQRGEGDQCYQESGFTIFNIIDYFYLNTRFPEMQAFNGIFGYSSAGGSLEYKEEGGSIQ